jgi:Sulfatase
MSTASMAASVVNRTWPPPFDAPSSLLSCPQQQQMQNNNSMKEDEPQMGGRCNYAAELEHLDRLMAKIYHSLPNEDSNGKNQTVICIVGDHGDMLGDHSMMGKKVPWQGSIRVPMICFGPGIVRGLVYNSPVTTLDLVGTFLDMAQTVPNPDMTTKSLRPILSGEGGESVREYVSSGLNNWRLVIQEIDHRTYKLICCRGSCHEPKKMERWKDDRNDTTTITTRTPLVDVSLGITPSGDDTISTSSSSATNWNLLLYDTSDEFDMNPIDNKPEIVNLLRDRLPKGWCPRGEEEEGVVITVPAL